MLAIVGLLAAACGGERRPDVVLVVVDTLRADRLGCYGYERATSPFIDRLASEGAVFEDVTSQFSWTVPSMISVFTSQYLPHSRQAVPSGVPTLAEAFQRAGYATIGATANTLIQADTGLTRGFDHFSAPKPDGGEWAEQGFEHVQDRMLSDWTLDDLVELARPHLAAACEESAFSPRGPVFLYLHALEPHDPYQEHAEHPAAGELPVDAGPAFAPAGWHAERLAELGVGAEGVAALDGLVRERAAYDREVRAVDGQLERAFATLRELGLLDDAVFALIADHGEGLWDHLAPKHLVERSLANNPDAERPHNVFYQKHGALQYEEVVGTPLVLWGSGVPAGTRVSLAVENVDLFPTLLELCGVPSPGPLDGRSLVPLLPEGRAKSLVPLLHDPLVPWRSHVYSRGVGVASVRELGTGLKLVVRTGLGDESDAGKADRIWGVELYDLARDPLEREDLTGTRRADAERLVAAYRAWAAAEASEGPAEGESGLSERLDALGYTADDVDVPEKTPLKE